MLNIFQIIERVGEKGPDFDALSYRSAQMNLSSFISDEVSKVCLNST